MLYTLVAIFLDDGMAYVERRHLTLQHCAGYAAMARMEQVAAMPDLRVAYRCLPEKLVSN